MTLADLIARHAAFTPDKVALRFGGETLTYAAFSRRIETAASALRDELGVGVGDRVAVLAENHADTLVLLYACARLGAMLTPLNWRLAVPEQLFILEDAGVTALVVGATFAAVVPPLRAARPATRIVGLDHAPSEGVAFEALLARRRGPIVPPGVDLPAPLLIVYTSGTTGRPKGAVLAQEALVWNAGMSQHMHGLTSDDHVLAVLPFFHVGGLNIQTTPALQHGATVTIHPRFSPQATLAAIAGDRPSLVVLVPATLQALVEHPAFATTDLSGLRAVTTGSTFVPQRLVEAFEARGVPVLQVYGATETCPIAVYTRLGGDRSRPGSTGLPGLHCEARIVDARDREVAPGEPGEIVLRGPAVFRGYWGDEAATREALRGGWYRSGDIAVRDPDGYVTVHDRKGNLIISGGENIYPAEIERVLLAHPDVAEVAVVGRPDPKWGEAPIAHVVLREGARGDAAALAGHLSAALARFKVPRHFVFVETLPRNALGKVQHFRLRDADQTAGAGFSSAAQAPRPQVL